jgi:hypothetical protein
MGVFGSHGAYLFFDLYIHYSGLSVTNFHLDVVEIKWFMWLRGLTCDFWAENGERKIMIRTKPIE